MKNKTVRLWVYILGILPIIVLACLYTHLPEQVPMRWGINGVVEYDAKWQLWILFSMGFMMAILFDILPKTDPKKKNYEKFGKYYDLFALMMVIFLNVIESIILVESFFPETIAVSKLVIILIGILFVILGNMMPKIKSNFYMGIKTPWTLSNTDIWNKTQRLGGRMMFATGVVSIISGICFSEVVSFIILMASVVFTVLIPVVMSYVWYRRLEK